MSTRRKPVDSTLIVYVSYSNDAVLEVEFRNGTIYRYFAVPRAVYDALLAAESKGAYFNRFIKPRFPAEKLPS